MAHGQKPGFQVPYGYYSYFYGYSYMGPSAGMAPGKAPTEGYYPAAYPFMPQVMYPAPRPTYRKRIPGTDPDYAKKFYSHLARVNSPDTTIEYKNARFFVIKSFTEEDVHKCMKYQIWSSTPEGNKRLNEAYAKCVAEKIPLFLFFSVNGSGQFVGVAKMMSDVNFSEKASHWLQDGKWLGKFKVEWVFIKDIPNREFKSIIVPTNENKPVTNTRDAQEIPFPQGMATLKIFRTYAHEASLLDEFEHYDNDEIKRKEAKAHNVESFGKINYDAGRGKAKGRRGGRGRGGKRPQEGDSAPKEGGKPVVPAQTQAPVPTQGTTNA